MSVKISMYKLYCCIFATCARASQQHISLPGWEIESSAKAAKNLDLRKEKKHAFQTNKDVHCDDFQS